MGFFCQASKPLCAKQQEFFSGNTPSIACSMEHSYRQSSACRRPVYTQPPWGVASLLRTSTQHLTQLQLPHTTTWIRAASRGISHSAPSPHNFLTVFHATGTAYSTSHSSPLQDNFLRRSLFLTLALRAVAAEWVGSVPVPTASADISKSMRRNLSHLTPADQNTTLQIEQRLLGKTTSSQCHTSTLHLFLSQRFVLSLGEKSSVFALRSSPKTDQGSQPPNQYSNWNFPLLRFISSSTHSGVDWYLESACWPLVGSLQKTCRICPNTSFLDKRRAIPHTFLRAWQTRDGGSCQMFARPSFRWHAYSRTSNTGTLCLLTMMVSLCTVCVHNRPNMKKAVGSKCEGQTQLFWRWVTGSL